MNFFKKAQYIIIYVLGFILIGATSLMSSNFGWRGWHDWAFYFDVGLTYAALICVILATLLKIIDDFKQKDEEYLDSDKKIKDFAMKTYIPSIFSKYCDHTNKQRKLKQYVYNIKHKIYLLEKKASEQDLAIWVNGTQQEREANKYCKRRLLLEKQLTDAYIKANIDTTKVKYDKVSSAVVLGGYYAKDENKYVNDFVTKGKGWKAIRENLPRILFGFAMTSFASSIMVSFTFNTTQIIPIIVKCFTLIFQAFMTIRYANEWNQTVTLKDIRFRKGIIAEYETWIIQEYKRQQEEKANNPNKKDPKSIVNSLDDKIVLPENLKAQMLNEQINTNNIEEV